MVRRSFAVRDITEILIHWQAGRSIREICSSLGVARNTIGKYVAVAKAQGHQAGGAPLSPEQWTAFLKEHAPELTDPAIRSLVFAEIARFHDSIVEGLAANSASTVWQRLHDEGKLRASLRSFRRYLAHHLPEHLQPLQPTVLRDDPPRPRGPNRLRLPRYLA
jgi:hypothetical protein